VVVDIRCSGDDLIFEVSDDGTGFDTDTTVKGSGLTNMADRLDALGGRVEVMSKVGSGTTLRGSVPVPARSAVAV
jgi:signal transduction histidine kinase